MVPDSTSGISEDFKHPYLEQLLHIDEKVSGIIKIMGLEDMIFKMGVDTRIGPFTKLKVARSSDGRLKMKLVLGKGYEYGDIEKKIGHEMGHIKFSKNHPMMSRFLQYLINPLIKVYLKYKKFSHRVSCIYLPYLFNECFAYIEARKRGVKAYLIVAKT